MEYQGQVAVDGLSPNALECIERLESVAVMMGGAAHDVANLLGVIHLSAESTLRHTTDERTRTELESMLHCARFASELVSGVLRHARPNLDRIEAVDLTALLETNDRLLRTMAGHQVQIETDLERIPPVAASKSAVLQIVANLVTNAAEAMGPMGGTITLRTHYDGDSVVLVVADDGPGFEPSAQQHALEPFFTTKPEGYGLGLALVDRLARRFEAELDIDSCSEAGTTIALRFPVPR